MEEGEERGVNFKTSITSFVYDGNGNKVKSTVDGETILFICSHYEFNVTISDVTKYYFAGTQHIAMRKYTVPQDDTLTYLLGDHLESTSLIVDADTVAPNTETINLVVGYSENSILQQYNNHNAEILTALRCDKQQKTYKVPADTQALDRFAYTHNNPVIYNDPSWHDGIPITLGLLGGLSSLGWAASGPLATILAPEVVVPVLVVTFRKGDLQQVKNIEDKFGMTDKENLLVIIYMI